jgi:hypothetical protein
MSTTNTSQLNLFPTPYNHIDKLVLKSALRFYTTQCSSIPTSIVSRYFQDTGTYQLLYWSAEYILEKSKMGTILHNGTLYTIIYKNCNRGVIHRSNAKTNYKLSFRSINQELNESLDNGINPTVIISTIA